MLREERKLAFDHPIAVYLRGAAGRDRRVNSSMIRQLGLDPDQQWRFESVIWEPLGATASITLVGFVAQ